MLTHVEPDGIAPTQSQAQSQEQPAETPPPPHAATTVCEEEVKRPTEPYLPPIPPYKPQPNYSKTLTQEAEVCVHRGSDSDPASH